MYTPPKDPLEYEIWKQVDKKRRDFYKEKSRKEAQERKIRFEIDKAKFRQSKFFYPLMVFYILFMFCFYMVVAGVLIFIPYFAINYDYSIIEKIIFLGCVTVVIGIVYKLLVELHKVVKTFFWE